LIFDANCGLCRHNVYLGSHMRHFLFFLLAFATLPFGFANAQNLTVTTVTRVPFSMEIDRQQVGFSMDLLAAIADDLGRGYEINRVNTFGEMLGAVEDGTADLAIANISITSARELVMDFTHPIFASGLQIMIPASDQTSSIWRTILTPELGLAILGAFLVLFAGGMLMWVFERRAQDYFDKTSREAMFPAFWWALNLIVNGGFEERVPRTVMGRLLGTFLVVSSLFLVSIFVAKITTMMTVDALQSSITSVNDLHGKRVGTTSGSTAANFMTERSIRFAGFDDLEALLVAFEDDQLDAVVFDAPILAYYATNRGFGNARLVGNVFLPENYGIAVPQGSALIEPINQSLLKLREDGTYRTLMTKWFGQTNLGN